MLDIIIGIGLILFGIISTIVSIGRTPENLRGWYGTMYVIIAIGSLIGGIYILF